VTYETIWAELETAPTPPTTGRLQRRIKPEASCDIFLGVRRPANQRMLLVEVAPLELETV